MPTVQLDQIQYTSDSNVHFGRMVKGMRDRNWYDVSKAVEGFTTTPVSFAGSTDPGLSVTVRHSFLDPKTREDRQTEQTVTANNAGRFQGTFVVQPGENTIDAFAAFDDTIKSTPMRINYYYWAVFLTMYAIELLDMSDEQELILLDSFLTTSRDQALRDNFGVFTRVKRPVLFSRAQYRVIIQAVLQAYQISTTDEAFNIIVRAFTSTTPRMTRYHRIRTCRIGTQGKISKISGLDFALIGTPARCN